jgi:hypothetical protein
MLWLVAEHHACGRAIGRSEAMAMVAQTDVGRPTEGRTTRIEYRMERMPFMEHPEAHIEELLNRVNELGKQGWRVVSVDLTYHPSYSPAAQPGIPLPVLLERELKG